MKVIGTELYDKGMDAAVAEFITIVQKEEKNNLLISPSDANVLVHARRKPDFKKVIDDYFWNLPDGVPSVWVMKIKGSKTADRCSGPDFFKRIMMETKDIPIKHYFCGGAPGVANELAEVCKSWGNNNVVGTYCPPFKELSDEELAEIAQDITAKETNVLWVGLGAPKQQYFSHRIAQFTQLQFIVPVGAAFDFHIGKVKKAPLWIQKLGMEWFYRVCQEPKRLFKRYIDIVPKFIFYNLIDR
jgi:N-acetylglucosaminyldiphosphoundecaprenol N-acetyl-beta-D-mannosaminyltransferase